LPKPAPESGDGQHALPSGQGLRDRVHAFDRPRLRRALDDRRRLHGLRVEETDPAAGLGCGSLVDQGVHALILDTRIYAAFCNEHNHGEFLHHVPYLERKADGSVMRTAQAIERAGFQVDWPLWEKNASNCTPCAPGQKCH
jgi:hypothetical protein